MRALKASDRSNSGFNYVSTPRQNRRAAGFTLIEIMIVTIVIGILAATALGNFIQAQEKAKVSAVIDNMHTTQIAAEAYATDCGGLYASDATILGPYFPNGSNTQGGAVGIYPDNPYSGNQKEIPFQESIADSATIQSVRTAPPTASPGGPGQVGYNQCDAPACTSYCVTGATSGGMRVGGATYTLVLTNH